MRFAPGRLLISGAILALGLLACRKDPVKPQWDLDLVAPLVKTSLTLANLVGDSLIGTDGAGNVSIHYATELFSLDLDSVLTAPDTSFQYAYALPFQGPLQFPPGTSFESTQNSTRFNLQDIQLTKLLIRSGQVDVAIRNMMDGHIVGDFSLPGATRNGQGLSMQLLMPPGTPASPSLVNRSSALDGYTLNLTGPDHNSTNTLASSLNYSSAPDGDPVTVTDQDSLLATVSYHDIIPEYATGYFGSRTLELDADTARLDLFRHVTGTINLSEAGAQLRLVNGIGVDARAQLHSVKSINTRTGQSLDLLAPITSGVVNISRAWDAGNRPEAVTSTYAMDASNSNIKEFLENLPDLISYDLDVAINPLGNISNGHDFIYHDSKLTAALEVDIPLRLIATNLALSKVMEITLPGSTEGHAIQSGILHLFADNGFPFSADITLEVVNDEDEVIVSLLNGGQVPAAPLGDNGLVEASVASRLDVPVGPEQMTALYTTGRLAIRATFNTVDQQEHVRILESYRMDLQATVEANYIVNGDQ